MRLRLTLAGAVGLLLALALLLSEQSMVIALSDVQSAPDQRLQAGDLVVQYAACPGGPGLPVNVENMAPGAWHDGACVTVSNEGESTLQYRLQTVATSPWESVSGFFDTLSTRVRAAGSPPAADPLTWGVIYEDSLRNLWFGSTLEPGASHHYYLEFQVDGGAGNAYQAAQATCDILFDASWANPPGEDGPVAHGRASVEPTPIYLLPVTGGLFAVAPSPFRWLSVGLCALALLLLLVAAFRHARARR